MINPAVETDLVGDLIEVSQRSYDSSAAQTYYTKIARGRCRAVTSREGGSLLLWLEMIDERCLDATRYHYLASAIGDVVAVGIGEDREGHVFRLVRGEQP